MQDYIELFIDNLTKSTFMSIKMFKKIDRLDSRQYRNDWLFNFKYFQDSRESATASPQLASIVVKVEYNNPEGSERYEKSDLQNYFGRLLAKFGTFFWKRTCFCINRNHRCAQSGPNFSKLKSLFVVDNFLVTCQKLYNTIIYIFALISCYFLAGKTGFKASLTLAGILFRYH